MTVRLNYMHPAGPVKTREFNNIRDAAKYGVAYYLTDNGYASPKTAGYAASVYIETGSAYVDGIEFWDEEEEAA